ASRRRRRQGRPVDLAVVASRVRRALRLGRRRRAGARRVRRPRPRREEDRGRRPPHPTLAAAGGRHDAALTVAGFCPRLGWGAAALVAFAGGVAREAGDEDPADRGRAARDSAERHADGGAVYGLPQMIEVFGDAAARAIAKIVGYRGREAPEPTPPDDRPLIKVAGGTLCANADEAERA